MADLVVIDNLEDFVESLKRVVAGPGQFATLFPETTDADLVGILLDAFAEIQLDRLLKGYSVDTDGTIEPALTRAQGAMVVLYASGIMLRSRLLNLRSHVRYEASGSVFEEDYAVNLLRDLLADLNSRKQAVKDAAKADDAVSIASAFYMADAYVYRTGALAYHPTHPAWA